MRKQNKITAQQFLNTFPDYLRDIANKALEIGQNTPNKVLNLKITLEAFASNMLKYNLFKNIEDTNNKFTKDIIFIDNILRNYKNPSVAINKDINMESVIKEREVINKKNYHFPDVLNLGDLINMRYLESRLLSKDDKFFTRSPFYVPIKQNNIAFLSNSKTNKFAIHTIESIALKLILSLPKGLVKVSIFDKFGSGQNFPNMTTLHNKFTEGTVLSEDRDIENELKDIRHSINAIAQSIQTSGLEGIEEYNLKTDEIAQRYHILLISNFPNGFSKKAIDNLNGIIKSGYMSGVYVLMGVDYDPTYGLKQIIHGTSLESILSNMVVFDMPDRPHEYIEEGLIPYNIEVVKTPLPNDEEYKTTVNSKYKINPSLYDRKIFKDAIKMLNDEIAPLNLRPIIDIEKMYIPYEKFWSKNAGKGITIPFGKRGIESIYCSIGIDNFGEDVNTHHGIIGGATGSGKTVFIHDIILMASMLYSPTDLEFWLLDYKEGTEFAIYKDFPFVKILSMESEIEFGHQTLEAAIKEMEKRGALFKQKGVANLHNYNQKVPKEERLPRIVIIIDEFQNLFPSNNQKITFKSNSLIDDILRRGRSFGINLFLSTQTLKGVDLNPAILSNMPLRIGLRMDEKDAVKIFSENNLAPAHIEFPGEGIYNSAYGNPKYNHYFQAFKCIDNQVPNTINYIMSYFEENLNENTKKRLYDRRFVYNGAIPAYFYENEDIQQILSTQPSSVTNKAYVGEPSGLSKELVSIEFNQDYGEHLLIVGEEQIKAINLLRFIYVQLHHFNPSAELYLFNFNRNLNNHINETFDTDYVNVVDNNKIEKKFLDIYETYKARVKNDDTSSHPIFISLFYIENGKLFDGGYTSEEKKAIDDIIKNGSDYGIYLILYAANYSTLITKELGRDINKFKKKIALRGGESIRVFGPDSNIKESEFESTAIILTGKVGSKPEKFKPFVDKKIKDI
jgi:hypothetical protein